MKSLVAFANIQHYGTLYCGSIAVSVVSLLWCRILDFIFKYIILFWVFFSQMCSIIFYCTALFWNGSGLSLKFRDVFVLFLLVFLLFFSSLQFVYSMGFLICDFPGVLFSQIAGIPAENSGGLSATHRQNPYMAQCWSGDIDRLCGWLPIMFGKLIDSVKPGYDLHWRSSNMGCGLCPKQHVCVNVA